MSGVSPLGSVEALSSLIVAYVGDEEHHKELVQKREVETVLCSAYDLSIPAYYTVDQQVIAHAFQENNRELAEEFEKHKKARAEYVTHMRLTALHVAQKLLLSRQNLTAIFFAPACLERPVIGKMAKNFQMRLISFDLPHLERNLGGITNIALKKIDLSGDLWKALGPVLMKIEAAKVQETRDDPQGKADHFTRAYSAGVNALARIFETYSFRASPDEILAVGEQADYVVSFNIATDIVSTVIDIFNTQFTSFEKHISRFGAIEEGPEIKIKLERFWNGIISFREKVVLRHFELIAASLKPGGALLFADTTVAIQYDNRTGKEIKVEQVKIPPAILKQIEAWEGLQLQSRDTVLWPRTPQYFGPHLGLGFNVEIFSFTKPLPAPVAAAASSST